MSSEYQFLVPVLSDFAGMALVGIILTAYGTSFDVSHKRNRCSAAATALTGFASAVLLAQMVRGLVLEPAVSCFVMAIALWFGCRQLNRNSWPSGGFGETERSGLHAHDSSRL